MWSQIPHVGYIYKYIYNKLYIYNYYYFLVAKKVFGVLGDMGGSHFFAVGSPDIKVLPNAGTFPKHSVCLCRFWISEPNQEKVGSMSQSRDKTYLETSTR